MNKQVLRILEILTCKNDTFRKNFRAVIRCKQKRVNHFSVDIGSETTVYESTLVRSNVCQR